MVPAAAVAPSALALTNFTWTGATPSNTSFAPAWSKGGNWLAGIAPAGSVGTLSFPALASAACTANPPTRTCYSTSNDISALNVNALSLDDGAPTFLFGNAITLGAGGITASPSVNDNSVPFSGGPLIDLPITLGAPQTWSITGGWNNQQLTIAAAVTGSANAVAVRFNNLTNLNIQSDVEVGAVTATGYGQFSLPIGASSLNGTNGNSVRLSGGAGLIDGGAGAKIGPLTSSGARIQVGQGFTSPDGTLAVGGAVTLDSNTILTMFIDKAGSTPGTDFSQLSATGTINLGNAKVRVDGGFVGCQSLPVGDVATLITTTGSLTGTFGGVPNGTVMQFLCAPAGTQQSVRINYTAHTVTATLVPTVPTVSSFTPASGITGSAVMINGTDFTNTSTVKFGALTSPTVTLFSSTQLRAVVPNGASAGKISVTTSGQTGTSTANFIPTLSLTGYTPNSQPVGTVVTITGVGFTASSTVAFNGTSATSVTFVSPTQLKATIPTGATTGPLTVTNTAAPTGTVRGQGNYTVT